jgi:16S rRNA processing protein RimM
VSKQIIIGKILSPHGVKGLFHLASYTQNPQDIFEYNVFDSEENPIKLNFIRVSAKSKNCDIFIASINDIEDRSEIAKLTNREIFVFRSSLPQAKEGEYYFSDLEGLRVFNHNNDEIGKISTITDFGAGTLMEVNFLEKKKISQFFPFNKDCVIEVGLDKGTIKIDTKNYE